MSDYMIKVAMAIGASEVSLWLNCDSTLLSLPHRVWLSSGEDSIAGLDTLGWVVIGVVVTLYLFGAGDCRVEREDFLLRVGLVVVARRTSLQCF